MKRLDPIARVGKKKTPRWKKSFRKRQSPFAGDRMPWYGPIENPHHRAQADSGGTCGAQGRGRCGAPGVHSLRDIFYNTLVAFEKDPAGLSQRLLPGFWDTIDVKREVKDSLRA